MGVLELWRLLEGDLSDCNGTVNSIHSNHENLSLRAYAGKSIGIDLSVWVVESISLKNKINLAATRRDPAFLAEENHNNHRAKDYLSVNPFHHLQILFIRTINLLKYNINPVYVCDGKQPVFKRRMNKKGDLYKPHAAEYNPSGRPEYRQCQKLLSLFNLQVIKPVQGEAEAVAAHLNRAGQLYAVISPDADAFLFGAHSVINSLQANATKSAAVVYSSEKIQRNSGLGQDKMIAAALLLGSDYCTGVRGIGLDKVEKLLARVKETEALQRLEDVITGKLGVHQWETISPSSNKLVNDASNSQRNNISNSQFVHLLQSSQSPLEEQLEKNGMKPLQSRAATVDNSFQASGKPLETAPKKTKKAFDLNQKRIEFNAKTLQKVVEHYASRVEDFHRTVEAYKQPNIQPPIDSITVANIIPKPDYSGIYGYCEKNNLSMQKIQLSLLELHLNLALQRRARIVMPINCDNSNDSSQLSCATCNIQGHASEACPYTLSHCSHINFATLPQFACYLCGQLNHTELNCNNPAQYYDCVYMPEKIIKLKTVRGEKRYDVQWKLNSRTNYLTSIYSCLFPKPEEESNHNNSNISNDIDYSVVVSEEHDKLLRTVCPELIIEFEAAKQSTLLHKANERSAKQQAKKAEKQKGAEEKKARMLVDKEVKSRDKPPKAKKKKTREKNDENNLISGEESDSTITLTRSSSNASSHSIADYLKPTLNKPSIFISPVKQPPLPNRYHSLSSNLSDNISISSNTSIMDYFKSVKLPTAIQSKSHTKLIQSAQLDEIEISDIAVEAQSFESKAAIQSSTEELILCPLGCNTTFPLSAIVSHADLCLEQQQLESDEAVAKRLHHVYNNNSAGNKNDLSSPHYLPQKRKPIKSPHSFILIDSDEEATL
jgi:5'-3' exonuclease